MIEASVREDARPGFAILELKGGAGDGRFRLRRHGHAEAELGPGGWQAAEAVLTPAKAEAIPGGLRLRLGPGVVDHIELGTPLHLTLLSGGETDLIWPDITPSLAGDATGRGVGVAGPRAAPEAAASPPPAEPEPEPLVAEPRSVEGRVEAGADRR